MRSASVSTCRHRSLQVVLTAEHDQALGRESEVVIRVPAGKQEVRLLAAFGARLPLEVNSVQGEDVRHMVLQSVSSAGSPPLKRLHRDLEGRSTSPPAAASRSATTCRSSVR